MRKVILEVVGDVINADTFPMGIDPDEVVEIVPSSDAYQDGTPLETCELTLRSLSNTWSGEARRRVLGSVKEIVATINAAYQ